MQYTDNLMENREVNVLCCDFVIVVSNSCLLYERTQVGFVLLIGEPALGYAFCLDPFYDYRGINSTFPLFWFLKDELGVP